MTGLWRCILLLDSLLPYFASFLKNKKIFPLDDGENNDIGWTHLEELSRDIRSRRFDVHKTG